MSKLAIDVVLLPSEEIMDLCVGVCDRYYDPNTGRPGLNKVDNLPHVSLFMGMNEESHLDQLQNTVSNLTNDFQPINTALDKLTHITDSSDYTAYFFEIKNVPALRSIHEKLVTGLTQFYAKNTTIDMLYRDENEQIDEKTLRWIDGYVIGSSFEKFWPHITLKACKDPIYKDLPKEITLDRLAICHLGNFCTCRKILWETKLK